ncbi:carbohydrate ABC transporter permease [Flindersiella endophytica]
MAKPVAYKRIALNLAGVLVFAASVFPVFWMVSTALKPGNEIFGPDVRLLPAHPTLENFRAVLEDGVGGHSFWVYLSNSLIVALGTVVAGSLFALLSATAVARFRFRLRTSYLLLLIVMQMVPAEALVIPLFLMVKRAGLYDQLAGLIVVNVALTLPFAIWMLRSFVAAVPRELEEAAAIDGAGQVQVFWRILFPLVAPGLVATSIFSFITAWNEFIFALTLIQDDGLYTMPVALRYFFGRDATEWGSIMAASTLMTVPVIVFFLAVQRRMVSGLVAGAVKG